jgi:hypothetical protein
MTLDASGNLLVGTESAGARLSVRSTSQYYDWGVAVQVVEDSPGSSNYYYVYFRRNDGTQTGYIWSNGGTSTAYVTSSDYRLKENVHPMQNALAKVMTLKPCTYTWKENGEASDGFIAHELQEVCPQAVSGQKDWLDKDGAPRYQGVDASFLVATLTAAIQELSAKNDALEARLSTLESA